ARTGARVVRPKDEAVALAHDALDLKALAAGGVGDAAERDLPGELRARGAGHGTHDDPVAVPDRTLKAVHRISRGAHGEEALLLRAGGERQGGRLGLALDGLAGGASRGAKRGIGGQPSQWQRGDAGPYVSRSDVLGKPVVDQLAGQGDEGLLVAGRD